MKNKKEMKKLIILLPIFLTMFFSIICLASAADEERLGIFQRPFSEIANLEGAGKWVQDWILGLKAIPQEPNFQDVLVTIIIFVLIIISFGDIISRFSAFSPWVSWTIAVCIGLIAGLTRLVVTMAQWMLQITAWAGTLAVFIALITSFLAFAIVHLFIGDRLINWAVRRQGAIANASGRNNILEGVTTLGSVGRRTRREAETRRDGSWNF